MKKNIRTMLGDRYHLCESYKQEKEEWKLFVKYDGWLDDGSKPIMTSESHTKKELETFAKQREILDYTSVYSKLFIISIITFIISIFNIFISDDFLAGILVGNFCTTIIILLEMDRISKKNRKAKFYNCFDKLNVIRVNTNKNISNLFEKIFESTLDTRKEKKDE